MNIPAKETKLKSASLRLTTSSDVGGTNRRYAGSRKAKTKIRAQANGRIDKANIIRPRFPAETFFKSGDAARQRISAATAEKIFTTRSSARTSEIHSRKYIQNYSLF